MSTRYETDYGTLVKGDSYSFANKKVYITFDNGVTIPVIGLTDISYTAGQNKEDLYGSSVEKIMRGRGNKTYSGSMTVYLDQFREFEIVSGVLQQKADMLDVNFTLTITWYASPTKLAVDVLKDCEFKEIPISTKQNDTGSEVKLDLLIGKVVSNWA